MKWTTDYPTEAGPYWVNDTYDFSQDSELVFIDCNDDKTAFWVSGSLLYHRFAHSEPEELARICYFYGPLEAPETPEEDEILPD